MTNSKSNQNSLFDYRVLRLLVGLVALSLPVFAIINSSTPISSISGSYHTENQDIFVGSIFVIGAIFMAYNGHTTTKKWVSQKWVSRFAAIAAIITALYPTACYTCDSDLKSNIHYAAAVILFATIAYFCLGPFRSSALGKPGKEAERRATIYLICGGIILGSLAFAVIAYLIWSGDDRKALAITYYVEWVSLWAFAVAWSVAGKAIPGLANEEERLYIIPKK